MPIVFSCSCGKAMKARDAFAGRKVRCPQCDKVLRIPQLDQEEDDLPAVMASERPSTAPVAQPAATASAAGRSSALSAGEPAEPAFAEEHDDGEQSFTPLARPMAAPVPARNKAAPDQQPAPAPVHAWVDLSLTQQPTPWLPGDEERFQKGIKAPREGLSGLEKGVLGLLFLVGLGAAGLLLFINK